MLKYDKIIFMNLSSYIVLLTFYDCLDFFSAYWRAQFCLYLKMKQEITIATVYVVILPNRRLRGRMNSLTQQENCIEYCKHHRYEQKTCSDFYADCFGVNNRIVHLHLLSTKQK